MAPSDVRPVVYLTSGIFGYLYRFFPIGQSLIERGHVVVVTTPSSEAAEHARAAGFEVRHLAQQEAGLDALPRTAWPRPWRSIARRIPGVALGPRSSARRHWEQRSAILADTSELEGVLTELDPKLVLTEAEEHRDIRLTAAMDIDLMLFEDLYSARPGPDVPFPARSHQVPTGTRWSRIRAAAGWKRFLMRETIRRRAERWWVSGNDWHSMLDGLASTAELGEAAINRHYFQFYDYVELPRIRTVAPELAFPGEPQPPLVVGPIVDAARDVHQQDEAFEDHWARVLQQRRSGSRVVYVSVGTFLAGMEGLTSQIIEAARQLPRTEIVVSVGRDRERWSGVELPDNVNVFARVPQTRVLADADVAVSTGGLNTGHEALWFGVPVLNLPVAGLDTPGNAARLAYHGVGRRLSPRHISIESIRDELAVLLDDPGYRHRANRLGEQLRNWDGRTRAVEAVETHLSSG